ncbi:MAG: hypothetical protein COZ06_29370 [Armatimonadetes bacterium CG_4_10_14_3_um_filter_66_18]|nr:DUF4238 domain-containing protein [Armatimonadota bacterium]NCQ28959.1 DUF4238 domain-containing protein [Armatimonadota bacterium]PIU94121.1 MAG: hypothetical protein COS65_09250 [Armatimonadetes bacterium CG06_land_8_20_14_3_00_66_21]PIY39619.1 MAG: hypothetical protein COZ06_29370 [Armatimonadetes bacterium CG_4_10_14_3_um_filter_66_18]PJB63746.1 MAG: hypothetical protein CO096_21230 [Armatimonadetes bacterium CG_4_9_14_3_um_filter_66_14]
MARGYTKNHYVPRFLLERWAQVGGHGRRLRVYDILRRRRYTASLDSFAAQNELYIPRVARTRALSVEHWLSGLETSLAALVAQVHDGVADLQFQDDMELAKAMMGLLSLECRSRHDVEAVADTLSCNPELRARVTGDPDRDDQTLALENLVNHVTERYGALTPMELVIQRTDCPAWILTDRPAVSLPALGMGIASVSPNVLVGYQRGRVVGRYVYVPPPAELVDAVNTQLAMHACEWLVAPSDDVLNRMIAVVESGAWHEERESERAHLLPVEHLLWGVKIDR